MDLKFPWMEQVICILVQDCNKVPIFLQWFNNSSSKESNSQILVHSPSTKKLGEKKNPVHLGS